MKAVDVTDVKKGKDDFADMYDSLTNPEKIKESSRQHAIKQRLEDKKSDTGL